MDAERDTAEEPEYLVGRDRDGFPTSIVMLPGPGFYELFEPLEER